MPKRDALSLGLLWVLASAVFWNGLGGHFVGDDFPLIVNNTNLPRSEESPQKGERSRSVVLMS